MPSRNRLKPYAPNSYYHIYNRGVEKRTVFQDEQDYNVFLSYLKTYLSPKDEEKLLSTIHNPNLDILTRKQAQKQLRLNNFALEIKLHAYCLMPNHFHLLIFQQHENSIKQFMNSIITRYVMYFNRKNSRVGALFQDVYKAVLVTSDSQLIYLTRYIHRNPQPILSTNQTLSNYPYSSYSNYLGDKNISWVNPNPILSEYLSNPRSNYQEFVEIENPEANEVINNIIIE